MKRNVKFKARTQGPGVWFSPLGQTLAKAGLRSLASNATYMLYPNEASRSAGNRHYLYKNGAWTEDGSTIDGTMLATGAISGGAGTHSITLPAATASRVQVIWESSLAHVVAFEIGFNRVLTTAEQAAFNASWMGQILAGTGLTISGCRAVYTGDGYYVDSVNGDDENAGGITAPFATIAALLAADTSSNKSDHYAASGSLLREAYQAPNRPGMRFIGYGRGPKPEINASDLIAAGSWSKTDGRTNIYQITVSDMLATGGFVRVWEDGTGLTLATSLDNCDATAGTYFVSTHDGPTTIYVHASDASNPGSSGKIYEHTGHREYCYSPAASSDSWTVQGINFHRNYNNNGAAWFKYDCTISWCRFKDGTKHNCLHKPGCIFTDCTIDLAFYVDGTPTTAPNITWHDDAATSRSVTYRRCVVKNGGVFFGHFGNSDQMEEIIYDECLSEGECAAAPFPANQTKICRILNCSTEQAVSITGASGGLCQIIIDGGTHVVGGGESAGARTVYTAGGNNHDTALTLRNATFRWADTSNFFVAITNQELRIEDCTFEPTGTATRTSCNNIVSNYGVGSSMYIRRMTTDTAQPIILVWDANCSVDVDYNTYIGPINNDGAFKWRGTDMGYAAWKAASGQDVHSVVA